MFEFPLPAVISSEQPQHHRGFAATLGESSRISRSDSDSRRLQRLARRAFARDFAANALLQHPRRNQGTAQRKAREIGGGDEQEKGCQGRNLHGLFGRTRSGRGAGGGGASSTTATAAAALAACVGCEHVAGAVARPQHLAAWRESRL